MRNYVFQGPIVQSIVSLTSLLVVKMLTVLVSTISKSQVFLLKKCEYLLQMQKQPASVAQLDAPSDWRPEGRGFNPRRGRQHSFVENDHEIFSTVILSLPLIQEGQLSVSGERMCTILVNHLED